MATEQVWSHKPYELPLEELHTLAPDMQWKYLPAIAPTLSPVEICQVIGEWYRACSSDTRRQSAGQFFTPPPVARYMATIAGKLEDGMRILDPGAGVGILTSAICETALQQKISTISIIAYESDPILHALCRWVLTHTCDSLNEQGINVSIELHKRDFVEAMAEQITQRTLWSKDPQPQHPFDIVILNPPYFKVNQKDPRAELVKAIAQGRTNMYTIFMSLAASALRTEGRFVSITPRSFASGAYFKHFRQQFFTSIAPELIHIFDSRRSTFEDAEVLQENIILSSTKKGMLPVDNSFVTISRSHGLDDLDHPLLQQIQRRFIIDDKQKDPILHLPTSDIDMHLLQAFKRWNNSLATYGLEISTGPVVAFRALDALTTAESVEQGKAVPLLWLQHIRHMSISWPLENFDKPQAVLLHEGQRQLVKNVTQIILRRFSAKEEPRRITAAVLSERTFGTDLIALENHLNYLYRPGGTFAYEEAVGLAAFLNSSLVDRYFRIMSGNTQVSATELRNLPLPSWEHFVRIGEQVVRVQGEHDLEATEHIIMDVLGQDLVLGSEEDIQLIDRNPDDPIRPTNSPNTCYALTNEALETLKQYGSQRWEKAVAHFLAQHGALWEQYQRSRQAVALPLKLADGAQFYLTPGKHNELQVDIVEKFGPRYARNALVLYLGDAANKFVIYEREKLEQLGVPITNHDKLPDVILYQEEKNWLYLIEAVTSHGPVSHKRKYELEKLLQNCTASPIYITAFHTTREFRRHAAEIAWETEVWIAETPEHMIHYNGDRFEGPHEKTTG